ncbi:molecular chaperone HtpG [Anaerosphaera aminiphila DSM 21120]|uniref:Chaperone protein HtpG n=1 Tax=Anaerosphaera aminiphila DSM 21120 TaxID=1120995 RepID=A0A1M5U7W0_9FIRM|nr:molecular chaperone HtpG [Anaerosphaera aminiphila]SHH59054.1 molecular chaperone HtpG [Anaerosphaera aminiphila DSM 21120]
MTKRKYKAESKRLMEIMVNSIYTNKEIFLRELISNASDAIDKMYYKSLSDENLNFNKDDYYIEISVDSEERTITIKDTGIGMDEKEIDKNLGTIAQSGTLEFKNALEKEEKPSEIIGQFGVGFYSSFLVSKEVEVLSKKFGEDKAWLWTSDGVDGYSVEEGKKESHGTEIKLYLKDNSEDENYDDFLNEHRIESLVKSYSNYIRYPIKMLVTKTRVKDESAEKPEYEEYKELEVLNSMIPIWKKNKSELKDEDYINFYHDQHYGFDEPLTWIHINVEGVVSYRAILYIPETQPFDFRSKSYKKGLQLYSNGVLIMDKCDSLLPDCYSFVKGVVDSEDLSLNISREVLQEDRQLRVIAKNIENKITSELKKILEKDREKYEKFYENFGQTLKIAVYETYGMEKDKLQDLFLFYSSKEKKLVTLSEYFDRMKEDQDKIYYATGGSIETMDKLPQGSNLKDKDIEVLYLTDSIDEFVLKVMGSYKEKEFSSISQELESSEETADKDPIFDKMKDILGDEVVEVKGSDNLGDNPVALLARGDLSIEMEKVLQYQDNNQMKAQKVLEVNKNHSIYKKLEEIKDNEEELKVYTKLLYDQARLIEGLPIEDPVEYTKNIWKLIG